MSILPPVWNIANILTVTRIVAVPIFAWTLLAGGGHDTVWRLVATVVFVVASLTDQVDGHLARSRGIVTDWGKIADPIADKLLTGTALVLLAVLGDLPWWVVVVVLVREWGITAWRLAVLRYVVVPASRGGKLKTVLQTVAISLYLLPLAELTEPVSWAAAAVMGLAVAATVITGVDYLIKGAAVRAAVLKAGPGAGGEGSPGA